MNELLVLIIVVSWLALAYLWIYPRFAGNNVKKLAYLDMFLTLIPIGVVALIYWVPDPPFRFVFFETNWFIFTLLAYAIIEVPLFALYIRARGLWGQVRTEMQSSLNVRGAAVQSVEKQLNDTKWDGLRTHSAKVFLVIASNIVTIGGAVAAFFAPEPVASLLILFYVILVLVLWQLMRISVRLVMDAPDEALDERLVAERDNSYALAYRWLSTLVGVIITAAFLWIVVSDSQAQGGAELYIFELSWPQIYGILWLVLGYTMMLPSMTLLIRQLRRRRV